MNLPLKIIQRLMKDSQGIGPVLSLQSAAGPPQDASHQIKALVNLNAGQKRLLSFHAVKPGKLGPFFAVSLERRGALSGRQ